MGKTMPTAEGQWRPGGVGARGAGLTPFALARGARPQGDPRLSHADSCRLCLVSSVPSASTGLPRQGSWCRLRDADATLSPGV